MNMATTGSEQKRQPNKRKRPALNEKLIIAVWLNSDKMDSSDENGMAMKMVDRIKNGEER